MHVNCSSGIVNHILAYSLKELTLLVRQNLHLEFIYSLACLYLYILDSPCTPYTPVYLVKDMIYYGYLGKKALGIGL